MKQICCAAFMGLCFMAAIATPVGAQATNSWHYIKVLSGPGNVNGAITGIDQSWVKLKLKWSSPCPSPRSLIITAPRRLEQINDLGPVGEVEFLLPAASDSVTVVMTNGPCEARSEVQIFAAKNAGAAISGPVTAKEQENIHQSLKNEPKPKNPKPIKMARELTAEEMQTAYNLSVDYLSRTLQAPSTAHYAPIEATSITPGGALARNSIVVRIQVDAQNLYGAMLRSMFLCRVWPNRRGVYDATCYEERK